MKRILVYSHDTYGLGNIQRMLTICQHLIKTNPDLTILFITGSPMVQGFRIPDRFDYVKLPCITRGEDENYSSRYLEIQIKEIVNLRSDLILSSTVNFKPDLLLVDKKPFGVNKELYKTINYLETYRPRVKKIIVLRDILDSPEKTINTWKKNKYYEAIESFYDLVLILGSPEIFDSRKEYLFEEFLSDKVRFCGYIKREGVQRGKDEVRRELKLNNGEKLILVMSGGGEDGYQLLEKYILGLKYANNDYDIKSIIFSGPCMSEFSRNLLQQKVAKYSHCRIVEFSDNILDYINAADMTVSMAGYNTICEILSLKKRAIVVPRDRPVKEQYIRVERMEKYGFFKAIHLDTITPRSFHSNVMEELNAENPHTCLDYCLDFNGLPRLAANISML